MRSLLYSSERLNREREGVTLPRGRAFLMCSITMTDNYGDRDAAQLAAAEKARAWIAAFLARPGAPKEGS